VDSASTPSDLELLRRHAPRLSFDSLETLRPTRVDAYLAGSAVLDREEQLIATSGARGPNLPARIGSISGIR